MEWGEYMKLMSRPEWFSATLESTVPFKSPGVMDFERDVLLYGKHLPSGEWVMWVGRLDLVGRDGPRFTFPVSGTSPFLREYRPYYWTDLPKAPEMGATKG